MNILDALKAIHNPAPATVIDDILPGGSQPARVRLLKEEMIAFQAGMTFLKRKQKRHHAEPLIEVGSWNKEVTKNFPFGINSIISFNSISDKYNFKFILNLYSGPPHGGSIKNIS